MNGAIYQCPFCKSTTEMLIEDCTECNQSTNRCEDFYAVSCLVCKVRSFFPVRHVTLEQVKLLYLQKLCNSEESVCS